MELRHLRYFCAVAEQKGFAKAAAVLNVSQSAISEQMRDMEDELGVPLFNRREHRANLNANGEAFLVEARKTLAAADQAIEAARRSARGQSGTLRIGFFVGGTDATFTALIRKFRALSPGVRISLLEMGPVQQNEAVSAGTVDIGFTRLVPSPHMAELSWELLYAEPLVVALPRGHALASGPVELRSLAAERLVVTQRETSPVLFDKIIFLCRAAGFSPTIAATAAVASSVLTLVAAGEGIAIMPKNTLQIASSDVVWVPILGEDAYVDFVMAWAPRYEGPLHRAFLQLARETWAGIAAV